MKKIIVSLCAALIFLFAGCSDDNKPQDTLVSENEALKQEIESLKTAAAESAEIASEADTAAQDTTDSSAIETLSKQSNYSDYETAIDSLSQDKNSINDLYSSILGDLMSGSVDLTLVDKVRTELVPQTEDYINSLKQISIADEQLQFIHDIYISSWNTQLILFNTALLAANNRDKSDAMLNIIMSISNEAKDLDDNYENLLSEYLQN